MAKFEKDPNWVEEVYKIERTDPVVATVPNRTLEQLTKRTDFLKAKTDELSAGSQSSLSSLEQEINTLKQSKQNNLTISSSVSSSSTGTVANSKAVKTAYDKAVQANSNAETRLLKSGGVVTGSLEIRQDLITPSDKAICFSSKGNANNIDHLWFSDGDNPPGTFYFSADSRYRDKNSSLANICARNMFFPDGSDLLGKLRNNPFIGIPMPYPSNIVPDGFLAMNGQTFSKNTYPKLARMYPSGKLPDLRGLFIRGTGGNAGDLLVKQGDAIRNIKGKFSAQQTLEGSFSPTGPFTQDGRQQVDSGKSNLKYKCSFYFDASRVVPTAEENRPVNMAFQYICLAE